MIFALCVLLACFYFGRFSTSVLPVQDVEIPVASTTKSPVPPQTYEQPEMPIANSNSVYIPSTRLQQPELTALTSKLIQVGQSAQLFRAIYDQKVFSKTQITLGHVQDLRTRFRKKKADGFVMHKSLRDHQDRDLIALLQAFAMNKHVYSDLKVRGDYMQFLKETAQHKNESLTVRRQAVRNLAQLGAFMDESERKRLWKDIPSSIVSLATHSDTELVGALLEK